MFMSSTKSKCYFHFKIDLKGLQLEPFYFIFVTFSYILDGIWLHPLSAELNPICHLLALLGAHHILHVSRIRVNCLP